MPMPCRDVDLLLLEPTLFAATRFEALVRMRAMGSVNWTSLTLTSLDADLNAAGVAPGDVLVVGGMALEVVSVDGPTDATVSRARTDPERPPMPPPPMNDANVVFMSFEAWRTAARETAAALLTPDGGTILDPGALRHFEAAYAVHEALSAAAAGAPEGSPFHQRAEHARRRLASARDRLRAPVDMNGDGIAETVRTGASIVLRRS